MQILIVALLPAKITQEILDLSAKYHPKLFGGKELPPHFSLVPPIPIIADLASVRSSLQETISQLKSFPITTRGIGTFTENKNVIFYQIVESVDLNNLHRQINSCLNNLVDRRQISRLPFQPHITFAKKMTDKNLKQILNDLSNFSPKHIFELMEIGLFALDGHERFWRLANRFNLPRN